MKLAILILPALAMLAAAQEPMVNSPVHLESVTTDATHGDVRIAIALSAPVQSSTHVVVRDKSLILDLPGIAYGQNEKRLVINRNGVEDVWVSVHQQDPPFTRITVRLSRLEPYILSRDGTRINLQIGAAANANSRQQGSGTIPTARAGGIARVFRRAPRQPSYEPPPPASSAQNEPPSVPLPPIRFPDAAPRRQDAAAVSPETSASNSNLAQASLQQPLPLARVAPTDLIRTTDPDPATSPEQASGMLEASLAVTPASAAEIRAVPAVPNPDLRTVFHVKFVQQDAAYIDAGRNEGIAEGMKLVVVNADPNAAGSNNASPTAAVAELTVVGIAETSAVTQIHVLQRDVVSGDLAYLSDTDLQALVQQHSLSSTRKYPAVISFTDDDDALDEEARAMDVPRPPLPSVNRLHGRIGFDYFGTHSLDASQAKGRDLGVLLRADFTRIGGTYWSFQGYYNRTLSSTSAASQATLQELINRTYQLGLTYDNPTGRFVAGFGRLYLPWASSLDTIDGGYFGRRLHPGIIAGIFVGSTPDPTSWNYNPNRQIGGTFVNFGGGSFDGFHYSSTSGIGIGLLSWAIDRPFIFFENSLSYRRSVSVYSAVQADSPAGNPVVATPGAGIGSSFFTLRWNPVQRLRLDFNNTYFRNIPTFDPTLVGTGLLDKYLFQGFSGGARVDLVKQIAIYAELGRSNRTGDGSKALNQMYGITFGRVPWLELRADAHYSRFNSSFGSGSYRAASLSRNINDRFRMEVLLGDQTFTSTLAGNQTAKFVTATAENNVGAYLFTQAGFTLYRGQQQNYNQWMLVLGYRFDSKWKRK
jgi:AMIN domain-containing protein